MARLNFPGLTALILFGLIAAEYILITLFVQGQDPASGSLIARGAYFGAGLIAITFALPSLILSCGNFGRLLILLWTLLIAMPVLAGLVFRPDHSSLMSYYLQAAFGSIAFTSFGLLFAKNGMRWPLAFSVWLLMLIFTIPAINEMLASSFGAATSIAQQALHITAGDHFLMATLLLIAVSATIQSRLIIYVVGFIALAAIGSRTSLYAYVVALPIILVMTSEAGSPISFKALAAIGLIVLTPIMVSFVLVELANTRMFAFFSDIGADTSVRERLQTLYGGWDDIMSSPVAGAFGSDIDRYGRGGYYIHNYLELWRQLGAFPFFLFIGLLIATIHLSTRRSAILHPNASFTLMLFLGPLLTQIAFSRAYGYPQIFFVLGMAAALMAARLRSAVADGPTTVGDAPGALQTPRIRWTRSAAAG